MLRCFGGGAGSPSPRGKVCGMASLLLRGGRIWTGNPRNPWAQSLAVQDGRILAVGEDREVLQSLASRCPTLDLEGHLVVPGLWDAHLHLFEMALARRQVCLTGCRCREELLERIRAAARVRPGKEPLLGWGWTSSDWIDRRLPDRHEIDRALGGDRPALFLRSDLHSGLASTPALRQAGYLDPPPEIEGGAVEVGPDGLASGLVLEMALGPLRASFPPPGGQEIREALAEALVWLHSLGITGVCDQRLKDQSEGPLCRQALAALECEGRLATRVVSNLALHELEGPLPVLAGEFLRLGHVKLFADGSLGSLTARMFEPYQGQPSNRGIWLTEPPDLRQGFALASGRGLPLSVHAIGDEAVRFCLDLFEDLPRRGGLAPHRMEHAQTLAQEDLGRLARLGVVASMQPTHLLDDLELAEAALGPRTRLLYRFRSLLEAGTTLAFGSDAPVADPNPFLGLHAAVHRQRPDRMERGAWNPAERISLEEALRACTSGPALACGLGDRVGRLAPGMWADLVVLDGDLFALAQEAERLDCVRPLLTVVGGRVVFRSGS